MYKNAKSKMAKKANFLTIMVIKRMKNWLQVISLTRNGVRFNRLQIFKTKVVFSSSIWQRNQIRAASRSKKCHMRLHLKMIISPVRMSIKHCDEMRVFSTTSRKQRDSQTLDVGQQVATQTIQRLGSKVKFVFRRIHAQLFSCCQPRILKLHKIVSLLRNLALKFKARRAAI